MIRLRDRERVLGLPWDFGTKSSDWKKCADGQARALRRAYDVAGVTPDSIGLVEMHATGTRVGDATELEGLHDVFGETGTGTWCALGSVKSMIGHTKAAAGAAGLIKSAMGICLCLPPR